MNIKPYAVLLRKDGFVKDYDSRAGGGRTVCFVKTVGDRKLDVQLWEGGGHRVSHFLRGRMSTGPSGFETPSEMLIAIEYELSRQDHPPAAPLNGFGCAGACTSGSSAGCTYPKCIKAEAV